MLLSKEEEIIYNNYLIASRTAKKQPFKIRRNFKDIDNTTILVLKKLSLFFNRHQNIKQSLFFSAPYTYYGSDNYFDISFFVTPKAHKCYSMVVREKEKQDPDSLESIQQIKDSCSFIYKFCKQNNLHLSEYITAIHGTTPIILQHLKDHHINFYTIHALNASSVLQKVEIEVLDFFIKDFYSMLSETRINYAKSQKLKQVASKALKLIQLKLSESNPI